MVRQTLYIGKIMTNLRSGVIAFLLAVLLHGLGLFAFLAEAENEQGDAMDAGELGIEVGLGTQGSHANIQERLSMLSESNLKKVEIKESAKTEKSVMKESKKEAVIKPIIKTTALNNNSVKAVNETNNTIKNEAVASPSESERETAEPKTQASAASVQAAIKSTGRSDQRQSGGVKGTAKNYINQMNRWLAQHQGYPMAAKKEKQEGTVRVAFTIDRLGTVLRRSIETSSGYPLLDDAALKVLDDASPLPPVPDDFAPGRAQLSLVKPIDFTLITNTSFKD